MPANLPGPEWNGNRLSLISILLGANRAERFLVSMPHNFDGYFVKNFSAKKSPAKDLPYSL